MKQKEFPLVKYSNVHVIIGGVSFVGCYEVLTGVNHEFDPRLIYDYVRKGFPSVEISFNGSLVPCLSCDLLEVDMVFRFSDDSCLLAYSSTVSSLSRRGVSFDVSHVSDGVIVLKFTFEYRYVKSYVPYRPLNIRL